MELIRPGFLTVSTGGANFTLSCSLRKLSLARRSRARTSTRAGRFGLQRVGRIAVLCPSQIVESKWSSPGTGLSRKVSVIACGCSPLRAAVGDLVAGDRELARVEGVFE